MAIVEIRTLANELVQVGSANPLPVTFVRASTYSAVIPGIAPTAAGVILQMQGSATKTIRIKRFSLRGNQGAAGLGTVEMRRYTTTATGTQSPLPSSRLDSASAAATGVLNTILTPGTAGTLAGQFRSAPLLFGSATVQDAGADFDFDGPKDQGLVLRGVGEFLGIALTAVSFVALTLYGVLEWSEE